MLRVISCGSIPPELGGTTRGGVATFHGTLIRELTTADHGVELVGVLPYNVGPEPKLPTEALVPPQGANEPDWYADALARLKPDAVLFLHITNRWVLGHIRRHSDVPAVGAVMSWTYLAAAAEGQKPERHGVLEEAIAGMTSLTFPSQACLEDGRAFGFTYPRDATAIPNPIDHTFYKPCEVSGERSGVLFVGALTENKRPLDVLQAANALDLPVTFAGDGPLRAELEAEAVAAEANARFLGWVDPSQVRELMLGTLVLCVPSRLESFGHMYVEAAACGTPSVGYPATLSEISARMGFDCGRPATADLADDIRRVAAGDWDREELRRRALRTFSPELSAEAYTTVLNRAAAT